MISKGLERAFNSVQGTQLFDLRPGNEGEFLGFFSRLERF